MLGPEFQSGTTELEICPLFSLPALNKQYFLEHFKGLLCLVSLLNSAAQFEEGREKLTTHFILQK